MDARILVQSLKGSKAQIMMAFLFAGHAMDVSELIGWTGLKRQTIQESIRPLQALGLLGSQKLEHGREVFILGGEMLPLLSSVFQLGDGASLLEPGQMSVLGTSVPTTTTNRRVIEDRSRVVAVSTPDVRKTDTWKANHKACRECGIGEPKATEIAGLDHVTPALIKEHVTGAGKGHIGLAIIRIIGNEPAPEIEPEEKQSIFSMNSFLCPTCHAHPCVCHEHDADCMCVSCIVAHPERECRKVYMLGSRHYECRNYVEPGHKYCSDHEEEE